ncbi:MAG: PfkB family carbohydrate kinase, partial [Pseudomonadota bacterium]
MNTNILCIGSVLWDVIGRAPRELHEGADVAGVITRLPGGVAFNIAKTCAQFGLHPILLSVVGQDHPGDELLDACTQMGLVTEHVLRAVDQSTDRYMAVEGTNGVMSAIADARTLEAAGDTILDPLIDGTLATAEDPYTGLVSLDGNLTQELLTQLAYNPILDKADLRLAPASPGKAKRLTPFVDVGRGALYVNCEEASLLCGMWFETSQAAAETLVDRGAARAIVTHGGNAATDATREGAVSAAPVSRRTSTRAGAA